MAIETVLETFNSAIDQVLAYPPGPKRWRAANDMWLRLSPKHRTLYNSVVQENREYREALGSANKYAQSQDKNSGFRHYLNIPTGAYYAIEKADPDVFKKESNAAKFFKEFKEYATAEVF